MRRGENDIRQMTTKRLRQEMARADAIFWSWQADGPRPGFDVETYSEELAEELKNRGQYEG